MQRNFLGLLSEVNQGQECFNVVVVGVGFGLFTILRSSVHDS